MYPFFLRYGDTFSIDVGPFRQIMVCDLDVLRDMMSMDVFSGRGKPKVLGINIFANMKGGHGGYGLVTSEGQFVCVGQIQGVSSALKTWLGGRVHCYSSSHLQGFKN